MIPMPQVPTAVGRPPVATGVSAPNRAATPRLAAPSVATAPIGRPPAPTGGMPPGGGVMKPQVPGAGGGMMRTLTSKFAGQKAAPQASPMASAAQMAAGAMGGWNAAPDVVANATKMLKAGAELGPQHRAPLAELLKNTDRPQLGPFGGAAQAAPAQRTFASRFRGPEVM